jgi:hypothetical protein
MKKIIKLILTVIFILIAIYSYNYVSLQIPSNNITNEDSRNKGISFETHYEYYVNTSSLIFNLKKIPLDKAPADIFRTFLQTSSALKDKNFKEIKLAYKGKVKFILKGNYFSTLGNEFGTQNPMHTIRTFPQNLYNIDGTLEYSEWTGGMFGVLGKQMDDFNDFMKEWWLNELIEK